MQGQYTPRVYSDSEEDYTGEALSVSKLKALARGTTLTPEWLDVECGKNFNQALQAERPQGRTSVVFLKNHTRRMGFSPSVSRSLSSSCD